MTHDDVALDARIARLEDLEEIRQLAISYKLALDGKDTAAYAALFAEAGVLWCTAELVAEGPAAIRQLVDDMGGNLLTETVGTDFHAITNHLIEVDGDRARGTLTWLYFTIADGGAPQLTKVGHYDDRYVREHGRWRFERREAPTDIPIV
jgi:ketosteroid isomerase-like protein